MDAVTTLTPEDVITALYRALLRRMPEPAGLQAYTSRLSADPENLTSIIEHMTRGKEYQAVLARMQLGAGNIRLDRFTNDYTQYGELEILLKLWLNRAARHRIVVDVGARGRDRSNSYDLMRTFGWRGLLIEANPALIPAIERDFAGLNVEVVNCAASDYEGNADFHIGVNDDVSSLNRQAALGWGSIQGTVRVPVHRLAPLLAERQIPRDFDLLSLDIEGEDIKVLNDVVTTGGYEPLWIIIEASNDFKTTSLADLPVAGEVRRRYAVIGQTRANLILGLQA